MLDKLKKSDYKLSLFVAIWIVFLLAILYIIIFVDFSKPEISTEPIEPILSRENVSELSNELIIKKEALLLPDSEVEILSDTNGKISNIKFSVWDYVKKWQILMQIYSTSNQYNNLMNDAKTEMSNLQLEYEMSQLDYNESMSNYTQEIENLENQIGQLEWEIANAILKWDIEKQGFLELEITKIEKQITNLQLQYEIAAQNNNSKKREIEWQLQWARNRYETYYTQSNQLTPRATINGTIWKIMVENWDSVHDWDVLLTITNVNSVPTLSIGLSFDEYMLTDSLSTVYIQTSDWDKYEWIISARNQTTNEDWLYEIIIEVVENIMDEEWNPDSTSKFLQEWQRYTALLPINSEWIRVPERCFSKIWVNTWAIKLKEWETQYEKDTDIISKLNDWILVNNFVLSGADVKVLCEA